MQTDHFLLISNLAHHSNEIFYTNGIPWNEFRELAEKNLKNLTRFQKNDIKWTCISAETISEKEFTETLEKKYTGIIISGSPYNINDNEKWIAQEKKVLQILIKKAHSPIIGVCFGHQLLADIFGGKVSQHKKYFKGNVPLITSNGEAYISYANHGQYISTVPDSSKILATGPENMPYIVQYKKNIYGIQCHLERKVECPMSEKYWEIFLTNIFSK